VLAGLRYTYKRAYTRGEGIPRGVPGHIQGIPLLHLGSWKAKEAFLLLFHGFWEAKEAFLLPFKGVLERQKRPFCSLFVGSWEAKEAFLLLFVGSWEAKEAPFFTNSETGDGRQ